MTLVERVNTAITAAMKAHDQRRLSALRLLKTAIVNKGVEKGRDLDDGEVVQVVASLIKQRRDSIDQFGKAGRTDLVDKETAEMAVLQEYEPPGVTPAEMDEAVSAAIAETGASSPKDVGKVMKAAMPRFAGRMVDGKAVNEAVRRRLAGEQA